MADLQYTRESGFSENTAPEETSKPSGSALKSFVNIIGVASSVALVAGVSVWGYQLIMRDVSGIPVVRAVEGEMRVRAPEPGGQLAQNTGLAVNEIAAVGEASAPADRLVLAPRPVDLSDEDRSVSEQTVAAVQQPEPLDVSASLNSGDDEAWGIDVAGSLQAGNIDELVRQLAAESATFDPDTDAATAVPVSVSVQDVPAELPKVAVDGPGLKLSKRPQMRPGNAADLVVPASMPVAPAFEDLDAASLPPGTRLVQLGAFASPEIAREQWDKLQVRFRDYLSGKDRVVQEAKSGGRTFFRLRAHGFTDLNEARRFCSALTAEGADCVPVVTR